MAAGTCQSRPSAGNTERSTMDLEQHEKMDKKIKREPDSVNNNCDFSPNSDIYSSRRNKRKMSEPKKRSDLGAKRSCPSGGSDGDQGNTDPDSPVNQGDGSVATDANLCEGRDISPNRVNSNLRYMSRELLIPNIYHRAPMLLDTTGRMAIHNNLLVDGRQGDDDTEANPNQKRTRKNYKNMTRERRVEANARERTRVHTISAAFESLRRAVPSYSYNQKLSKLAILKIASSYILALSRLTEDDYSDRRPKHPTFADCVDMCTQTIQTEGRIRRRH